MRILFISRAFPPVVGGIEQQNHSLSEWLAKHVETTTFANRGGKNLLPFFLPWVTVKALFRLPAYDILLLGDGVLACVGWILKIFYPKKTVVTILHGLDVTYPSPLYQKLWVRLFLPRLDGYITVSQATRSLALEYGLQQSKVFVIHNGIDIDAPESQGNRENVSTLLGKDIREKKILLTAGRLVKRKGVVWFIENVLPILPENIVYVVAGEGPQRDIIDDLVEKNHLQGRVFVLGRVSGATLRLLWKNSDLFIQPNIPVAGDIEGFGLSVVEASAAGLPVIASRLEGLQEAIQHEQNGFLVEPEDASAFKEAIMTHLDAKKVRGPAFAQFTRDHYAWSMISLRYIDLLKDFLRSVRDTH